MVEIMWHCRETRQIRRKQTSTCRIPEKPVYSTRIFFESGLGYGTLSMASIPLGESHMTAITFDTLKFVRRLRDAGVDKKQAEAFSEAIRERRRAS
ncbi:MAG: hypothetical protein HQL81_09700 [Magnetococcales bacterium]|nr:hypothetical protein [Magnetococcales bacterium]